MFGFGMLLGRDWSSDWWGSRKWLAWLFNTSPVRDHVTVNDRWGA
jgi:alpha-L-fucosidase